MFRRFKQGGARVKDIIKFDGYNSSTTSYSYGIGRHSGIPEIWFRKIADKQGTPMYFSGDRDQHHVAYEYVQQTLKAPKARFKD
jgi:hypothetical protein